MFPQKIIATGWRFVFFLICTTTGWSVYGANLYILHPVGRTECAGHYFNAIHIMIDFLTASVKTTIPLAASFEVQVHVLQIPHTKLQPFLDFWQESVMPLP